MAIAVQNFSDWLGNKLKDLNTDEGIFGDYIKGILDGDESPDEKNEALQGILGEIVDEKSINELCSEIMDMWVEYKQKEPPPSSKTPIDVDLKLSHLMETQSLQSTTKHKEYTDEEKKIRQAILSQYSEMSDDENESTEGPAGQNTGLEKNVNVSTVAHAEKEKREQAKLDSQKKKEKDKEDREKQKQMKEEKKEKRKTQKGERRR